MASKYERSESYSGRRLKLTVKAKCKRVKSREECGQLDEDKQEENIR